MRHRRRINTQTIRKKQSRPTQTIRRPAKRSNNGAKIFKFLFYLIILGALGYAGYKYVWPMFLQTGIPASAESAHTAQPALPAEQPKPEPQPQLTPIQTKIQVEVLNGCGEQGIAKILADRLIKNNYDVVNSGNYIEKGKTFFDVPKTKIIDQLKTAENLTRAKDLADLIGISQHMVESYENPAPIADISIVIGKDFKTLPIFKKD